MADDDHKSMPCQVIAYEMSASGLYNSSELVASEVYGNNS